MLKVLIVVVKLQEFFHQVKEIEHVELIYDHHNCEYVFDIQAFDKHVLVERSAVLLDEVDMNILFTITMTIILTYKNFYNNKKNHLISC